MSKKSDQVFAGWLRLSTAERDDVIRKINEYQAEPARRRVIEEQLEKSYRITLGPVGDACACCGRS